MEVAWEQMVNNIVVSITSYQFSTILLRPFKEIKGCTPWSNMGGGAVRESLQ